MSINERIKKLVEFLKVDQRDFAFKVGVTPAGISKTLRSESKPSYDLLESMVKAFPGLNAHWLLTGEGEMWVEAKQEKQDMSVAFLIKQLESLSKDKDHYRDLWQEERDRLNQEKTKLKQCETELSRLKNGGTPVFGQ